MEIQYDFYQLIHMDVVNQISLLAMFQRNTSDLKVYVKPLGGEYSLTDSEDIECILKAYAMLDAEAFLTIDIIEEPLQDVYYRNAEPWLNT